MNFFGNILLLLLTSVLGVTQGGPPVWCRICKQVEDSRYFGPSFEECVRGTYLPSTISCLPTEPTKCRVTKYITSDGKDAIYRGCRMDPNNPPEVNATLPPILCSENKFGKGNAVDDNCYCDPEYCNGKDISFEKAFPNLPPLTTTTLKPPDTTTNGGNAKGSPFPTLIIISLVSVSIICGIII